MIQTVFSQVADQAAHRYEILTDALTGVYHEALASEDFGSPSMTHRIASRATEIAMMFLDGESDNIADELDEIAASAHQTTLREIASNDAGIITDATYEHLYAQGDYLRNEIAVQAQRDVTLVRQAIQRAVLEVSAVARARGVSQQAALAQFRLSSSSKLAFEFHDRQARKWSSRKFIRTAWRHTLLTAYNEVVLATLADHGLTSATVRHADASSKHHGLQVSFMSGEDQPSYSEIRTEVFHPNSDAILGTETAHVSP